MNVIVKSLMLSTLLLSGCSTPPPPKPEKPEAPPTLVNASITVSSLVNPDIDNRASPIVVRMFELKGLGAYNESDFYGLFENYQSVLGGDLLGSEQFHLKPGETQRLKQKKTVAGVEYIAVIAAYRDINQAIWRDHLILPAGKETEIMIRVDKLAISIWKK